MRESTARAFAKPGLKREAVLLAIYTEETISHISEVLEQTTRDIRKECQEKRPSRRFPMLQISPQCRICPEGQITAIVLPSGCVELPKSYLVKTFENLQAALDWMKKQNEAFDLRPIVGGGVILDEEKREN